MLREHLEHYQQHHDTMSLIRLLEGLVQGIETETETPPAPDRPADKPPLERIADAVGLIATQPQMQKALSYVHQLAEEIAPQVHQAPLSLQLKLTELCMVLGIPVPGPQPAGKVLQFEAEPETPPPASPVAAVLDAPETQTQESSS